MASMSFPIWWSQNSISNLSYNPNLISGLVSNLDLKNLWEIEKDLLLWAIIWVALNTFEKSMNDEFEKVKSSTGSLSIKHIRWITRSLQIDDMEEFNINIDDMISFLKNPFLSFDKLSIINLSSNNTYAWMINNWNRTLNWIKKLQSKDTTIFITADEHNILIEWRWYNKWFLEKKWNTFFHTSKDWWFFIKTSLLDMTRLNMFNRSVNILNEIKINWKDTLKINIDAFHKIIVPKINWNQGLNNNIENMPCLTPQFW